MIKNLLILQFILTVFLNKAQSQDFLGISTGNYGGVTGVMLQPASIVDSRYKFDINLFSTGVNYSNNYFLVNKHAILKFNKNNFGDYQTFKARYLSEAYLPAGERAFFNITNRTQLPLSFMVTTGKKSAIALNIQSRSMIQGRSISGDLARLAYNGFYFPPLNNNTIDASGFNLNSLNWAEVGFTYGRVLYDSEKHFLKAAFTGKYLGGIASLNMGSDDVQFRVNSDSSVNLRSSNYTYNHNKNADFDMVFDKNFRPDANAFGFDAGLVYEFRGNIDKFKYIRRDDEKSYLEDRRDVNKYIFKLGVSLLDVGMFSFDKPTNVNSFSADINNWNLHNAKYNTIADFDTALANRVIANANDPRSYNVYLPTALSVQLDIKFVRGLYLNAMAYRPVSIGSRAGERFDRYGFYTITPRWERRHFGIYIPYTFSERSQFSNYRQNSLGATIRLGPLFVGSSNLGSMLFKNNLSRADAHIGFKVGISYGKPTKSSRFIQNIVERKSEERISSDTVNATANQQPKQETIQTQRYNTSRVVVTYSDTSRVVVDYNNGKIYDIPNAKGNIIILNNYYYLNSTPAGTKQDARLVLPSAANNYDTINQKRSELQQFRNQYSMDSVRKLTVDSMSQKRQQLDSLIKGMQQLQMQMDSARRKDSSEVSQKNASINPGKNKFSDTSREDGISAANNDSSIGRNNRVVTDGGKVRSRTKTHDSISISSPNVETTKKKPESERDSVTAINKNNPIQNNTDEQQKQVLDNIKREREYNRRLQYQQNELFTRYRNEAALLRADIYRLQSRLSNGYVYSRNAPQPTYAPVITPSNVYPNPTVTSTNLPFRRDTIYVNDTIRLVDTATVVKNDTINITAKSAPQIISAAPVRDTIISSVFDYTSIPADVLLFDLGKATLRPMYYNRLDFIANILNKQADLKASITGHTDNTGPAAINKKLSLSRASNVAKYLVSKGVGEQQLMTQSLSSDAPAVEGNSTSAHSQNRRVVIQIIKKKLESK